MKSLFSGIIQNFGWKTHNFVKKFDLHGAANSYELANSYGFLAYSIVRVSWTPLYERRNFFNFTRPSTKCLLESKVIFFLIQPKRTNSVGILKLREELRIAKTYEKWIKQEGTDKPPVCDNNRKKQENGIDTNKLTYQNLKGN